MSSICPVCNGMQVQLAACPVCAHQASDCGRFDDYLGPYSPYRDMNDIQMAGEIPSEQKPCLHLFTCTVCTHNFSVQIDQR